MTCYHVSPGVRRLHVPVHMAKAASNPNATQSVHAFMCECDHTAPHVQKITYYVHKYTHMHHFTHAHGTGGFQKYSVPKCVHVCSEWVLLGKAKATAELMCWCWVNMRQ